HVAAALEDKNALAGGSQFARQRAATRARPNNNHVVMRACGHRSPPCRKVPARYLAIEPRGRARLPLAYPCFFASGAAAKLTWNRADQIVTGRYLLRSVPAGTS